MPSKHRRRYQPLLLLYWSFTVIVHSKAHNQKQLELNHHLEGTAKRLPHVKSRNWEVQYRTLDDSVFELLIFRLCTYSIHN